MNILFKNTFRLMFRLYIRDKIKLRHNLILHLLLALSTILVSTIIDVDKLTKLTGSDNPWVFILAGFIVSSLLSSIFHMPRAFAENDVESGRFEYIMTTQSYSANYFWYYSMSLLLVEILLMLPVIVIFVTLLIFTDEITFSFNLARILMGVFLMVLAFFLTLLISTMNLYLSIISRRYKLNSSLIIIGLSTFSGMQYPIHTFPKILQYILLINPLAVAIELWRILVVPNYMSFISNGVLILFGLVEILVLVLLSKSLVDRMNKSIRLNGAGKLLE